MVRVTPPDRLEKLLTAAADVFVAHGFHRTQMEDIADRLGVSKGTLYRSVESKEALLAAVLEYADNPEMLPKTGPLATRSLADVSAIMRARLSEAPVQLGLRSAASNPTTHHSIVEVGDEVERFAAELFEMMSRHQTRIMVLESCVAELPMLASDWYAQGRYHLVDLWHQYLRNQRTHITTGSDLAVLSRTIVEVLALWAVKMSWDPSPRPYSVDLKNDCAAMVRSLVTGG